MTAGVYLECIGFLRVPSAGLASLVALLLLPAVAAAAPISVSYDAASGVRVTGTGDGDHVFAVMETPARADGVGRIRVDNRDDGINSGVGCTVSGRSAICSVPAGGSGALTAALLDGADVLELAGLDATADLGAGNDLLRAPTGRMQAVLGPGDDAGGLGPGGGRIDGGPGADIVAGGPGDDTVEGGEGADRLLGTAGKDALDGGGGTDVVSYAGLTTPSGPLPTVAVLLGATTTKRLGISGDGAGEDRTTSVEAVTGTPRADLISARDGIAQAIACGAGEDRTDLDLRDRLPAADDCEASDRGAVKEVPNVVPGSIRRLAGGKGLAVALGCPAKAGSLGCRGTLTARRGTRSGGSTSYEIAAGRRTTVRVAIPRKGRGALRVVSVESGRHGKRTTIRTVPAARASGTQSDGDLPPIGVITEDVSVEVRQSCPRPNGYVVGFKTRSTHRIHFGRVVIDGTRAIQARCAFMGADGGLTAPVADDEILGEFYGGDFSLLNAGPPEATAQCSLSDGGNTGAIIEAGVAHGIFAERAERDDPPYIRLVGLECAFADDLDPILNNITSSPIGVEEDEDIDATRICPAGTAVRGLRIGSDRTGRSADFITYGANCAPYPRPPSPPGTLFPGTAESVSPSTGVNFTWRRVAPVFHVCITSVSPQRCKRTTNNSLPVTELINASDVGSRFAWSVRACGGRAALESPDFACGQTANVPVPGDPIATAVRAVPRPPSAVSSSRPRDVGSDGDLDLSLSFAGGVFAARHRVIGRVGNSDAVERMLPEAQTSWGSTRSVDLAVPVGSGRRVVTAVTKACAGDPALPVGATRREVCGAEVRLASLLIDTFGVVCAFTGTAPTTCSSTGKGT